MAANILVVEDDADINEIISTQLSRQGHTCTQAFSGTEALMRLDAGGGTLPYDLVICDLMLPGATGEQIIDTVRGVDSALPCSSYRRGPRPPTALSCSSSAQTTTSPSPSTWMNWLCALRCSFGIERNTPNPRRAITQLHPRALEVRSRFATGCSTRPRAPSR